MSEHTNSSKGKVVAMIVAVVVVVGALAGGWYFFMYRPAQEAKEKARLEAAAKAQAEKKRKQQLAQKRAQYKKLVETADNEFQLENWDLALASYREASSLFSKEAYPKERIDIVTAKLDEIAAREARKTAGVVEMITDATGNYYVVVSSSLDDDLAKDYALKLIREQGVDAKVVAHRTDGLSYYGVALGQYSTWEEATASSSAFLSYSDQVWVLKY